MLEIVAVFISIGAILYHSIGVEFFSLGLFSLSFILFLSFVLRSWRGVVFSVVLGVAIILGAIAIQNEETVTPQEVFGNRAFDATVIAVDQKLEKTNLIVRDDDHKARLQVSLYNKTEVLPGDAITVRAIIERPETFITENGRLFDYPQYLASKGIVGVGKNAQVLLQESGRATLSRSATRLRFSIADIFSNYLPFPSDGVIAGMVVGYQGNLSKEIQDLFRDTGVLHVLVLSGYNITLLGMFLGIILRKVPFHIRTGIIIIAIIFLVVVSGMGVASLRAGVMGSIALFAGASVRTYRPLRAFTIAYLLFFFVSPKILFVDPGFHLSFLATAYMLFVFPKVIPLFSFIPETRGVNLRELLGLAVSMPLFMLPYTMYFSGSFPLVTPLANIVLALVIPLLMVLGIGVLFTSWVLPVAGFLGLMTSTVTLIILKFLKWCVGFPLWNTPPLVWWGVLLFYGLLLGILFRSEIMKYLQQLHSSLVPVSSSFD